MPKNAALILAAGKGTRMHSDRPKVLQTLLGEPMLACVIEALRPVFAEDVWIVAGHRAEMVQAAFPDARFVLIGDAGQKDAENYTLMAKEHPDQVVAIVILDVGLSDRAAEAEEWETVARSAGVEFRFVADARHAAQVLADLGVIAEAAVTAVAAAYERV